MRHRLANQSRVIGVSHRSGCARATRRGWPFGWRSKSGSDPPTAFYGSAPLPVWYAQGNFYWVLSALHRISAAKKPSPMSAPVQAWQELHPASGPARENTLPIGREQFGLGRSLALPGLERLARTLALPGRVGDAVERVPARSVAAWPRCDLCGSSTATPLAFGLPRDFSIWWSYSVPVRVAMRQMC